MLLVLGYPSIYEAGDHVPKILEFKPIGFEGLDNFLINNVKKKGMPQVDDLSILPEGKGWLVVEFGAGTIEEAEQQARTAMSALEGSDAPSMKLFVDEDEQKKVWDVREAGLGATAFVPGEPLTWEGWKTPRFLRTKLGVIYVTCASFTRNTNTDPRSMGISGRVAFTAE